MDVQMSQDRPRLRNFRNEALLRSAESGSIRHIAMLGVFEKFPDDVYDGSIVLRAAFRFLDAEPLPQKPTFTDSPGGHAVLARLNLILRWFDAVEISSRKIADKNPAVKSSYTGIYEENWQTIMRWLKFYMREANWAFTMFKQNADSEAPRVVTQMLKNMHYAGRGTALESFMHNSEEVVDLLITLWLWQDNKGNAAYLSYVPSDQSDNKVVACPLLHMFMTFSMSLTAWKPPPRTKAIPANGLDIFIATHFAFADIPGMAHGIAKFNFVGKVLELARAQGDIPNIGPSNTSFAVKAGHAMLHADPSDGMANFPQTTIPQLLQAGFLELVLDDMVKRHARNRKKEPFYSTRSRDERDPSPLAFLAPLCIHRRICDATLTAVNALPESMKEVLTHDWAAKYWTPFINTVCLYDRIWSQVSTPGRVTLCDNLKHVHHSDRLAVTDAKECSNCQSVVYCSVDCQKEDWELHRIECAILRVNRFDTELRSAVVSHRTRTFNLRLMQQFLLNVELGLSYLGEAGTLSEDGHTLTHPHIPASNAPAVPGENAAAAEARKAHIIQFNLDLMVPRLGATVCNNKTRAKLQRELEGLKESATKTRRHSVIYREALEEALSAHDGAEEGSVASTAAHAEDEPSQFGGRKVLALCSSSLGTFDVVVIGRFRVKNDEEGVAVSLLNGWVRMHPKKDRVHML